MILYIGFVFIGLISFILTVSTDILHISNNLATYIYPHSEAI